MDRTEATTLLHREMAAYAERSYADLVPLVGQTDVREIVGDSGTAYHIEVDVFWDSRPGGLIRVLGSIDDGGLRSSFSPISEDLLVGPDGTA